MISEILKNLYKVYAANSGERAIKFLERMHPDIILLDVEMPGMDGYQVIKYIKADKKIADIPVIFLTAREDKQSEATALELGAVDYIQKPVNSIIVKARIKLHLELELYRRHLEDLVEQKTKQVLRMQEITLDMLAFITEFRDKETGSHIKRTSGYVRAMLDKLPELAPESYQVTREFYEDFIKSAPLHDLGKVSIPDIVLLKPGRLTPEEFEIMKCHAENGAILLRRAMEEIDGRSFLNVAYDLALTHHERWDGNGYPQGLAGENIPLAGRIMAIADVYDALRSERMYKSSMTHEEAMQIMRDERGTHFDPILLDLFIAIEDKVIEISNSIQEP